MLEEIEDIAPKAEHFLATSSAYSLPLHVPYLGMGSSYFAPLAFKYMGVPIQPEIASEYVNYLAPKSLGENAVILSQSGRSTEALWATSLFKQYVAITNKPRSALGENPAAHLTVDLLAEDEQYSSSKTYVNTLLALFKGFGIDPTPAVQVLGKNVPAYRQAGARIADAIFKLISTRKIHGIYVVASGPNVATAYQAALILSESTKLSFTGMLMAQYDHGPKETAADSIVIQILAQGASYERGKKLGDTIARAGAHVFTIEEPEVSEQFSVLTNIVPFNYIAYELAEKLGIKETFVVGGKVTEVA
ncbi:MAG: hypothetical protein V4857_15840 [Pseudomonadota bacterium]